MKTVLAFIGGFVVILGILGTFGFGDFVLMYSPDRITCVKEIRHDSN
jgi:hypothetical protein